MFGSAWSQRCYVLLPWHLVEFLFKYSGDTGAQLTPHLEKCVIFTLFTLFKQQNDFSLFFF